MAHNEQLHTGSPGLETRGVNARQWRHCPNMGLLLTPMVKYGKIREANIEFVKFSNIAWHYEFVAESVSLRSSAASLKQNMKVNKRQRERQTGERFILAKQLCTCITLFCTFPSRRYTTSTWNFPISRFMEDAKGDPTPIWKIVFD